MSIFLNADQNDTIVAISTPPGVGAIGVVRLSGKDAIAICDRYFYGKRLREQESHTLHFGSLRATREELVDEVVVGLFKGPNSYTREDVVEVSCHGSPYILQRVVELFLAAGARLAKGGEFTLRAFMNGQMDLSQAEAVADLIASDSAAAHDLAIKQMRGGFSKRIDELRQRLIHFASMIELELDFGEEDVEFADRNDLLALVDEVQQLLRPLISSFKLGNVIRNGVTTVIAGRPNAGKSTLLNALLQEERAIVSPIAGTTRDTIEETLNIDGIPFRFIDTAGIREATDTIEAIGIKRTMDQIENSAIVIYMFDLSSATQAELEADLSQLKNKIGEAPLLIVANKTDIATADQRASFTAQNTLPSLLLSAKEGTALEPLKNALKDLVLDQKVQTGDVVVSNLRHYEALTKADAALEDVKKGIGLQMTGDLLSLDIRTSLHHLGTITGQVTTDDLLDNIFRNFCIGK